MVEPVGGLDQRRAGAGDRVGEGGAVAGRQKRMSCLSGAGLGGRAGARRRARRAARRVAGMPASPRRRMASVRCCSASLLAAGGDRAGGSALAGLGSCGQRSTQARTWGSSRSGGRLRATSSAQTWSSQARTSSRSGDAPGVEIVAIGEVEILQEIAGGGGAELLELFGRSGARSWPAAAAKLEEIDIDAWRCRAWRSRGRRRSPRRTGRAACSGSSAARPWDRRGLPRTNGTAGRGGPGGLRRRDSRAGRESCATRGAASGSPSRSPPLVPASAAALATPAERGNAPLERRPAQARFQRFFQRAASTMAAPYGTMADESRRPHQGSKPCSFNPTARTSWPARSAR